MKTISGPWQAFRPLGWFEGDQWEIPCVARFGNGEYSEGNAHLAAAAPDLLAELKNARAFMENVMLERGDHGVSILIRAADAAIAKAEGRS